MTPDQTTEPRPAQQFIDLYAAAPDESIKPAQIQNALVYGSLGGVMLNLALQANGELGATVYDPVLLEQTSSREYFRSTQGMSGYPLLTIVNPEKLPATTDIKAAFYYRNGTIQNKPVVELREIDRDGLKRMLSLQFDGDIVLKRQTISLEGDRASIPLITLKTMKGKLPPVKGIEALGLSKDFFRDTRTRLVLEPSLSQPEPLDLGIQIIDAIYNSSIFKPERESLAAKIQEYSSSGGGGANSSSGSQERRLEMRQEMRQEMALLTSQETLPLMAMQRINARQIYRGEVLKMGGDELRRHISDVAGGS